MMTRRLHQGRSEELRKTTVACSQEFFFVSDDGKYTYGNEDAKMCDVGRACLGY